MLKVIEIENIKGIQNKRFALDIAPNKPSLLVAPNGFGKSSLATAFNSMNNRRINLDEDDYYAENVGNAPRIYIEYQRPDGTTFNLFRLCRCSSPANLSCHEASKRIQITINDKRDLVRKKY